MRNLHMRSWLACCATVALLVLGGARVSEATLADTVYYNGKIYTITDTLEEAKDVNNAKTVDVVATESGRIIFAGSKADAKAKGYLDPANVGQIVDLCGKTMLPGFVDGHGHFPGDGPGDLFKVNLNSPPIYKMTSIEEYIVALQKRAEITPEGDWIQGYGYDDTLIVEMRHPTKADLDRASTTHPIYITHISGHLSVANSLALALAGVTAETDVEGVVKDANGEPTGLLVETKAMSLVASKLPALTAAQNQQGIARGAQNYAAAGVTTADQGASILMSDLPMLQAAVALKNLPLRVLVHPIAYLNYAGYGELGLYNRILLGWTSDESDVYVTPGSVGVGDDITSYVLPPLGTTIFPAPADGLPPDRLLFASWKMIFDGSNQGYTGWFKNPGYYDPGSYQPSDSFDPSATSFIGLPGTLNISQADLEKWVSFYHGKGQPMEIHTNGSAAAEAYLTAMEKAVMEHKGKGITDMRHCSIHAQMMERQHIERLMGNYDELAATADMYQDKTNVFDADGNFDPSVGTPELAELMREQHFVNSYYVNHVYFWGDRHLAIFMGPGRAKQMSPTGWSAYYGQYFTLHNDTNVTPISPLRSLTSAVARMSYGEQLVTGSSKDINAITYYKPTINATEEAPFWDYDQRVNVLQALQGTTFTPAYQNHVEDLVGTIAVGKYADFVILDKSPFKVAKKHPQDLADMRVACTIVSDGRVYGFMPDAKTFASHLIPAFLQASGVAVSVTDVAELTNKEAKAGYGKLPSGQTRVGTLVFDAVVTAGQVGQFQFQTLGNGGKVRGLVLSRLSSDKAQAFTYGRPSDSALADGSADGAWWLCDIATPTVALELSDKLVKDRTYLVHFAIADNGARDDDEIAGAVRSTVCLSTDGKRPGNGI